MVNKIKQCLGKIIRYLYKITYRLIPCDDKTMLFISFHGKGFSDNPKAIYLYLKQQQEFSDYKFVWAIKKHKQKQIEIEGAKIIEYFSIPYFFYLARSKYWIVNCKLPAYVLKKKTQIYLQTWHGTPLKRLAHDIEVDRNTTFYRSKMSAAEMYHTYDVDVAKYNYMISPNPFCTKVFQSAFQINRERLIETGYPRNDILVNTSEKQIEKLKASYGLPRDKKVILYAPTWRDNTYCAKGYTFTLNVDFKKWQERLGDEYVVIFKPHYLIVNDFDMREYAGFVYEISAEKDIAELYLISDILVSDYSSVFFDYAILNRPIYFYMFDMVEYAEQLRGFYFDIHRELPGEVVEEETALLDKIVSKRYDYDKLKKFNERFNQWHDGTCAKKVSAILFNQ
ncbi:MAG: CDP-glycerol glycerophosphotransferase family protein [Erysipelotrichia bacterium]|nr:CDP-glycerol glycerophosphotransferase family protein [Erysipelotrichia bacterium]NCC54256.1 CDP-glycerol glycerophosphotransferase family protein [Erysipelotrichia bacterium]